MSSNPFHVDESRSWFTAEAGWPDEVPKNIEFPKVTMGEMLRESARKWPDAKAVWFLDCYITYKELDELVDRFATALHNIGVRKGEVFTMLLPNSFQYVVGYYACARIGAIASGINPTYKSGEVLHQLKTIGAKYLLVLDSLYESTVAPIIDESPVDKVIATNVVDLVKISPLKKMLGKALKKIPTGTVPPQALRFRDLIKAAPNPPKVDMTADDVMTYIMTGGTTGVPKAAVLSHFNTYSNALQSKHWLFKTKPGVASIGVLPLFHSFAMTCVMNISLMVGAHMILFPRPPETGELLRKIVELGPEEGSMYPGAEILFKRIAEFPDVDKYDLAGKFELCVSGAGPLHRPVQEAFEKVTGARLAEGFGLTESTPVVSAHPFWGNRKIGTIGLPFPGTEWKIVDPGDWKKDIPQGEAGELAVAGPQVMVGYLNKPEETAETIVESKGKRWLLTGDIGRIDEHGRVSIEDRKKQLIKYKGYSVFPTEVETLLMGHEAVLEVAVAGLPDVQSGEIIKAWAVLKDDYRGKVSADEIRAWAKENLTHYKVPRSIELIGELPKSMVGKVMRRTLQEADPIWVKANSESKG
ncbi:MAG: AMP-binding protein [Candidatus Alcyoniella australis]|nr:AMP-binding protein [Candidatus Alcyoniella australis]